MESGRCQGPLAARVLYREEAQLLGVKVNRRPRALLEPSPSGLEGRGVWGWLGMGEVGVEPLPSSRYVPSSR